MAANDHQVILNALLTLGSATVTLDGTSITDVWSQELPEDTCFGDTFKQRKLSVQDQQLQFEAWNDYTDNELDEDLEALKGTAFAVAYRPSSGAIAVTNPEIQFTGALTNLQKTFQHGQIAKVSGSLMLTSGTVTRDIAP